MPDIHISFRFHVNFYHSYRGDSPDELGIGKDIRIIRSILDDLDRLNGEGIPVAGTWDIENHFSLGTIIPAHAPDILRRWQQRVRDGRDEIEVMSWNNGLVSAQTEEEFHRTIAWSISNPAGSGLADLFERWAPIVRPQECMFTPSHLRLYPVHGIRAVSLYYSAHPFNGFSTHIKPLDLDSRYNPLHFGAPGFEERMILLPSYNHGDIAENLGLKAWIRYLRRRQRDRDLLIIIDMDADDDFWTGYGRLPAALMPWTGGLYSLVTSVADLPGLVFARPLDYMNSHEPVGLVEFGQDTADGSYDGLASWAEKRENTRLWTGIQRSRLIDSWTRTAMEDRPDGDGGSGDAVRSSLDEALRLRLISQSTTHFGLASPVMHAGRLAQAEQIVAGAVRASENAFQSIGCKPREPGAGIPIRKRDGRWTLVSTGSSLRRRVPGETPEIRRDYDLNRTLVSGPLTFSLDDNGRIRFEVSGVPVVQKGLSRPSVVYDGKEILFRIIDFHPPMIVSEGLTRMTQRMTAVLPAAQTPIEWTGSFYVGEGQGWLLADIRLSYPRTADRPGNRLKAERLGRSWDRRWQSIRPFEIVPEPGSEPEGIARIWKHNSFGDISSYDIRERKVSSINNQITDGWIAFSHGGSGLLLGTTALSETCFAFCPIRVTGGRRTEIRLNPFGTYHGPQRRYPTARTGLARLIALRMADHLDSYAPSYNGEEQRITLLLIPYRGDCPPEGIRRIAGEFAMPPFMGDMPWTGNAVPPARVPYTADPS